MEEIDIGEIIIDKRNHGQTKGLAGKGEGVMELREQDIMAIGGAHAETARGLQTWGILQQATL